MLLLFKFAIGSRDEGLLAGKEMVSSALLAMGK